MIVFRSIIFNIAFLLWTLVVGVMAGLSMMFPERIRTWVQVLWADGAVRQLVKIAGIGIEVRGQENLPKGAAIVASKHQSVWDTAVFHALLNQPSIVLKEELLKIPLFRLYCRLTGMIPLDRSGQASSMRKLLRIARAMVAVKRPIMIFPEGTRALPGERLPYLVGTVGLYRALKVPVVPVALNSGVFWPRTTYLRYPGTIVIEFLEPIPPGLPRAEFMDRLSDAIESKTDELVAEGQASLAAVDNPPGS